MPDCSNTPSKASDFASEQAWISARSTCLLVAFGLAWLLPFLGSSRSVSYHEMIFAQPAREMLATGDWLQPRVAGVANNHKPPLAHWLIAASMWITGSQSEWVVRLPSMLAAIVTAWLMAGLATRWFGTTAGLLAGMIQLTTYYLLRFGKLADSDMLLGATVCGAMAAFTVAHVESPHGTNASRWLARLFYLAAGLSFLVKGPLGSVFIFAAAAMYLTWSRRWPSRSFFGDPWGLLLYAILVVAWPYAAYRAQPEILDHWLLHNVGRFQGELRGFKHPLYYVYSLPAYMLPWTPLAIQGARWGIKHPERCKPLLRMIVCWLLPGLIILSASAFKRKHYAIPLLPPLSVLAAVGLCQVWYARRVATVAVRWVLISVAVVGVALGAVAVLQSDLPSPQWLAATLIVASIGFAIALRLRDRGAFVPGFAALFAAGWLLFVSIEAIVAPHYDSYRSQRDLAARINERRPPRQPLYLVHVPENQITYYLDGALVRLDDEEPFVESLLAQPAHTVDAIAPAYIVERLRSQGRLEVIDRTSTIEDHAPARQRLTWFRFAPHGETTAAAVNPPPQRR